MKKIFFDIEKFIRLADAIDLTLNLEESGILYDKLRFHEIHKKNAEKVYEINFVKKNKIIAKVYLGIRENNGYIPYSSPFSNIIIKNGEKIENLDLIIKGLINLKEKLKLEKLKIILPASIYDKTIEEKLTLLLKNNFVVKCLDTNNYLFLREELRVGKSIERDYRIAEKFKLSFEEATLEEAYEVIKKNRMEKGYPLKMTKEHLLEMNKQIPNIIDSFIVKNLETKIAAAIVFKVTEEINQVIYWGNLEKYKKEKSMAFLAKKLIEVYRKKGKKILDIGPSSENGELNMGLFNFKKSIGCKSCLKFTLEYQND